VVNVRRMRFKKVIVNVEIPPNKKAAPLKEAALKIKNYLLILL
jgi:hypothetical protein